ncbi:uncharacterized protein BDR25DRAFT_383328 [Lindgomyces ingoldianus]|uniref:Uncharacterized protein n=1 Tax=Lindgomyces ingoldianus TaxID=673940 RepID=A0ACB6Q9Z4_9PLEO|nr:uncharacterized protein BDR25DRAFT_383328 [Lindgomyces ingoldianus]KAF2463721.1 hypothetical protein BDR25DRAFT_383328 [Lindgomyces ingoldianus]
MHSFQFPLSFLPFVTSTVLAGTACYLPNGDQGTDIPCNSSAPVSTCCKDLDACLSNGLCKWEVTEDTGVSFARGTCTDQTWTSPLCPPMCHYNNLTTNDPSAYDFRRHGVQVWECGSQGFAKEAAYCCESEHESQRCCSTSSAVFRLQGATIGPFTATASNATSSSSSNFTTTQVITSMTSVPKTEPTRARASSTTTASVLTDPSSEPTTTAVKIGAGIAGGLGGIIIIALIILLFLRQRRHNQIIHFLQQRQNTDLGPGADCKPIPNDFNISSKRHISMAFHPVEVEAHSSIHELDSTRFHEPDSTFVLEMPEHW